MSKKSVIVVGLIVVAFVACFCLPKPLKRHKFKKDYNEAWEIAMQGDYYKAEKLFKFLTSSARKYDDIVNSADRAQKFCVALGYYKERDYKRAKEYLDKYMPTGYKKDGEELILSDEQNAFIKEMITSINKEYDERKDRYDEEDRIAAEEEAARKKKAEEEEAARKQAAPYVGMSESKIDTTDLGKHSKYYEHFNTECISGEIYSASMYYWYSGGDCIYSARCVRGKVYNVHDYRDNHETKSSSGSSSGSKKKTTESTTEFDPDDHDIEQYYEDYKDEEGFEDIDDAYDDFEDNSEYWDDY